MLLDFKKLTYVVVLSSSTLLCGCLATQNKQSATVSYEDLTPEQRQQVDAARQRVMQTVLGSVAQLESAKNAQNAATPSNNSVEIAQFSSETLIKKRAEIEINKAPAKFQVARDGIEINGQMYLDPEGSIEKAGWDVVTGNFTYTVTNIDGSQFLKLSNAHYSGSALTFAKLENGPRGYKVTTADGHVMTGENVIPSSNGVIVSRGASAFKYELGQGIKSVAIPQGWYVTALQNGDVDSTGLLLLERIPTKQEDNAVAGLFSAIKSAQKAFGAGEVYDYALYDMNSGKGYLVNKSLSEQNVHVHSQCRRQNDVVNKCEKMDTYQSIYDEKGKPNFSHYYWSLGWFNTPEGPIAIYSSGAKVHALHITKDQETFLFERTLGVNWFTSSQKIDGDIEVKARLGFTDEKIESVLSFVNAQPATRIRQIQKI